SEKVKDAVKWGLDFHLINHPLDCPICDQAGECGLQEQYMEYGKYDSEMAERKVKKHKVVDLGPTVVLDSERCILCSRCVRFTTEVSKTDELGIFNRGDRSEIGTHDGKPLDNPYSLNTVDICPVGALTSKDFRFRQRVWYLKNEKTICPGCSTGCSVNVYFNKEGFFRVKPSPNPQVNGYWMCDEGRQVYKFLNKEFRQEMAIHQTTAGTQELFPGQAAKSLKSEIDLAKGGIAVVLTGQYTTEEYETLVTSAVKQWGTKNIFHWVNNSESFGSFDGLLIRGDKNPNTQGLRKVLEKHDITSTWGDLENQLKVGKVKLLIVAGPENLKVYPDLEAKLKLFSQALKLVWLSSAKTLGLGSFTKEFWHIPMKTFVEKSGTFVNHSGLEQKITKITTVISQALTLAEAADLMSGREYQIPETEQALFVEAHRRVDQVMKENAKKNEFLYKRGTL
ncbi:MAG TPA: NADH dehydrogenase subunit, partial [Pseudobdellovibrionaceae bacterium]|nr:NADH dehydrogenase subunit [Pseudobdellovibrionaceae bacterium]